MGLSGSATDCWVGQIPKRGSMWAVNRYADRHYIGVGFGLGVVFRMLLHGFTKLVDS